MTKQEILIAFYQTQIAALADSCTDADLLDLVYRLLKSESN
jgi:hypothetical protein